MNVFTHSCKEDGVMKSYIVKLDDHCDDHEKELPPCCVKEQEKKKDCCSDEVTTFQVKFDFFNNYQAQIPTLPIWVQKPQFVFVDVSAIQAHKAINIVRPPPKLKGKEILIQNQVFRI